MTTPPARPPFDPELEAALGVILENMPATLTSDSILAVRAASVAAGGREAITAAGLVSRDMTITSFDNAEIVLSIVERPDRSGTGPGIYHTHGGGMILGNRWLGATGFARWAYELNAVIVTVEYRLAPENPDPTPIEDCYAGLVWTAQHAAELGIEADRLMIGGASAGGGLAAGITLLARDRQGPALCAQLLMCPMLDDRDSTVSTKQIDGVGVWDRRSNLVGWRALLGDRQGTDDVTIYAAPARASDLSGLPPAYIDCGSAEVFRDENVTYATRIWESGSQAELHVWAGGFHGFEMVPHAAVSQAAAAARDNWISRTLSR